MWYADGDEAPAYYDYGCAVIMVLVLLFNERVYSTLYRLELHQKRASLPARKRRTCGHVPSWIDHVFIVGAVLIVLLNVRSRKFGGTLVLTPLTFLSHGMVTPLIIPHIDSAFIKLDAIILY